LAAGLFWALCTPETYALPLANFFLGCVLVAGIYGGLTASKKIIYIQALPAAVALLAVNFF
jgi:putative membrane protein